MVQALRGRDAELERLARALAAAAAGRSTLVAVTGAYGLGKTALLDAVRADAEQRRFVVLTTHGRAADAELGFASLLTLLRPLDGSLDQLAGDLAGELRAALAVGRRRADAVAVRLATLRVLSAVAASRPLLLVIDDAHLLDRASVDVLAFAVGRFFADTVLTVVAAEPASPTAFDEIASETITLEPLGLAELSTIVSGAVTLAAEPLRRCVELAEGNPLAAIELASSLDAAQRAGEAPMPQIPRLTGMLARAFARRLERLSDAARNALALVAADDTSELAVVAGALERLGEPETGIAEAEAAGLLEVHTGMLRFAHPLMRPVAYHQVGAASRRMAHAALASVLAAAHQGPSRAWQLVAAADRPDESVAAALALVAADVARRGGTASAARTMECAAALTPDAAMRRDRLIDATRAWIDAGDASGSARTGEALMTLPPTAEALAVGAAGLRGTRPAGAVLADATTAVSAVEPTQRPGVEAVLAEETLLAGAVDDAVGLAKPLAERADAAGDLARAVLARAGVAVAAARSNNDAASAIGQRAMVLATATAVDEGSAEGVMASTGAALGGAGLELAVSRALAAIMAGDVADAHDQLLRLDAVVPDRAGLNRGRLDLGLADVELLLGRYDEALARATSVADRAGVVGLGWLRGRAEATLGRLYLAGGEAGAAVDALRTACRTASHLDGADLVSAALDAKRPDEATRAAGALEAYIDHPSPVVAIRAHRGRGVLGAVASFDTALLRAEAARLPLEAAGVVMARAEFLRQSGDEVAAKAAAADAAGRFAACGVTGWGPRLSRVQQRSEAATPALASQLSPAEHRVALTVSEGRTNQEAADTLYLSVKTVDFHLQNIYRKLGLRSRTELAVAVQRSAAQQEVFA